MPRTTDFAIVAVPVVACLALFAGLGLLNHPGSMEDLSLPTLPTRLATTTAPPVATSALPTIMGTPSQVAPVQAAPVQTVTTAALDTSVDGSTSASLARGREFSGLLYSQNLTPLWSHFSPSVQQEWGDFQRFQAYRMGGVRMFGAEKRVVSEQVNRSGGVDYYTRTATFERGPKHDWTLVFGLNPAGQVVAFNIVAAGVLPVSDQ